MQQASSLAVIRDALAIFKDFIKKIKAAAETGYIPQELRLFVIETVGKRNEDRNYRIWLLSLFGGLEYGAVPSDFPKYKDIKMLGAIRRLAIELPTLPPRGHIGKYIRDVIFYQYLKSFHECKRDVITKYLELGLQQENGKDSLTDEQKIECERLTDYLCKDLTRDYFYFLKAIVDDHGANEFLKSARLWFRLAEEEKKRLEPALKSKIDSAAKAVRDHGEGDYGWEVTGPVDAAWAIVCHEVMTHTDPDITKEYRVAEWLAAGWKDITRRVIHINAMAHALSELKAVDEETVRDKVSDYVLIEIIAEINDWNHDTVAVRVDSAVYSARTDRMDTNYMGNRSIAGRLKS